MEDKNKVLLSVKDLEVKFRVRGRILTAIRGISLDIMENESIAIVGESGSGKSVFTKTFAGMLDSNGFISNGSIVFDDDDLSATTARKSKTAAWFINRSLKKLNTYSKAELGSGIYKQMLGLESEKKARTTLSDEETEKYVDHLSELRFQRTELYNLRQTFDPSKEKDKIKETSASIAELDRQIGAL